MFVFPIFCQFICLCTVNQQMFAAINVCGLVNQNISLLLMFAFLSWGELDGKPCFTKMAITPLIIFKIQPGPETRQRELQVFAYY